MPRGDDVAGDADGEVAGLHQDALVTARVASAGHQGQARQQVDPAVDPAQAVARFRRASARNAYIPEPGCLRAPIRAGRQAGARRPLSARQRPSPATASSSSRPCTTTWARGKSASFCTWS